MKSQKLVAKMKRKNLIRTVQNCASKISPTKPKKKKKYPIKIEYLILDFLKWKSSLRFLLGIFFFGGAAKAAAVSHNYSLPLAA